MKKISSILTICFALCLALAVSAFGAQAEAARSAGLLIIRYPEDFRREALERSGLSESMQVDDRVIYLRALLEGDAFVLPDVIGVYRIHTSNFSATVSADFVMSLQRENRWIYDEICRRHLLANPDSWWYEQSWIAIRFYIQNPSSDLSGLLRIFRFLRKQRISLRRDAALFKQSLAYWYARRRASSAGK